jgi:hypothetical protein
MSAAKLSISGSDIDLPIFLAIFLREVQSQNPRHDPFQMPVVCLPTRKKAPT